MNKSFWKDGLNRALRTVAQTLVGSVPTGFIVTAYDDYDEEGNPK